MKLLSSYIKIVFIAYIAIILFRVIEIILIVKHYGFQESLLSSESAGLLYDFMITNLLLILCSPFYIFIFRLCRACALKIFTGIFIGAGIIHLIILKYFLYQLLPLDTVVFQTPVREIIFTVKTSETHYASLIISIILFTGIVVFFSRLFFHKEFSKKIVYSTVILAIVVLPVFFSIPYFKILSMNKFAQNKSVYFLKRTFSFFFSSNNPGDLTNEDVKAFNESFINKPILDYKYPLLHVFDTTDVLGNLINSKAAHSPNIVLLIVEGLNNDFIQPYKGIELMPFLTELKNQSLYWENCLSTSERSFAVMPSLTGGLPYGKIGFTLLDILPRHLSLVSILEANDYYTSFFYGQGSWFHRKDRFFKQNHIDLIFDNNRFDPEYEKIIVGDDRFFWGYNDKDLFNQSLKVLDTLPQQKRLDIYFTGTSHSPFIINDKPYYNRLFEELVNKVPKKDDKTFFHTYKKYIESILFLDDALEKFFTDYQNRPEYKNTIFIITGDHPMTELPIVNSIKRYHVPLLIYSPLIKEPRKFSNIVSHLDLYETVLAFLASEYHIRIPYASTSLGSKLLPGEGKPKTIIFMNDNKETVDIYSDGYYLSRNTLYKVQENMLLQEISNNKLLRSLREDIMLFNRINRYVCLNNKILPDEMYCESLRFRKIYSMRDTNHIVSDAEYMTIIDKIPIPNLKTHYYVSFQYKEKDENDATVVYQFSDKNDSILLWKNFSVKDKHGSRQVYTTIPPFKNSDSTLYFQSYIWNQDKQKINYYNLNAALFSE